MVCAGPEDNLLMPFGSNTAAGADKCLCASPRVTKQKRIAGEDCLNKPHTHVQLLENPGFCFRLRNCTFDTKSTRLFALLSLFVLLLAYRRWQRDCAGVKVPENALSDTCRDIRNPMH
jgi:hypothetical protein